MAQLLFNGRTLGEWMNYRLDKVYSVAPSSATQEQVYNVLCSMLQDILINKRSEMDKKIKETESKQVFYLSMEFLIGKSLRNNLTNLGLLDDAAAAVEACGLTLDKLYNMEPDAALGNGGLGRLAACYMDSAAVLDIPATGYSILYEYGIFRQIIENGRQVEIPDEWLDKGRVWLEERRDQSVEVRFGGQILEQWYGSFHNAEHVGYDTVIAVPYDFYISGYDSDGVSRLRLWKAESPGIDMDSFNRGDYSAAMIKNSTAELISKILYPNDNQIDGKRLRLRQQYFLCAASLSDIVSKHLKQYGTVDNLPEKIAVHVNDTHPTLAIPELMRILLDECGYGWDNALSIVKSSFAYTNHTVLAEALERWSADLIHTEIPRIYEIILELDRNLRRDAWNLGPDAVERMAIVNGAEVRMANLCAYVCHNVNGVSALHSDIVRDSLFSDFSAMNREKFVNVTNGIAYRRWLIQGNPEQTAWMESLIGDGFRKEAAEFTKLLEFKNDESALAGLDRVKRNNKVRFAEYAKNEMDIVVNPDTLFDVQAKRIHEYKRQHLNALCIIRRYLDIISGNGGDFVPRTYLFGGKAAPGYYMAKEIIRLLCALGKYVGQDERSKDLLGVAFLPNFRVSMSELLMPAAELSEQISLAGKEASGTGNMKLMLSGALTIGTLDGANVEIRDAAGNDNFFLFGRTKEEVNEAKPCYNPGAICSQNPRLAETLDFISSGVLGDGFQDLVWNLRNQDPYMVLADFDDYLRAQYETDKVYRERMKWNSMSLCNIAASGIFSADRSVTEYSNKIWNLDRLKR